MIIKDKEYGEFDVCLADDGTMNTVLTVEPSNQFIVAKVGTKEIRFSTEYGAEFRDAEGTISDESFAELAQEAFDSYVGQYLLD